MTIIKPTVSVVIPVYNRVNLLYRAIDSVLDQIFEDFELIIVDDGSADDIKEVVKHYNDPRVYYLRHEKNFGVSKARNTGVNASRGKYIAFLDSDDEWLPQKLQKQIELFEKSPDTVGAVYTGIVFVKGRHKFLHMPIYKGSLYLQLLKKCFILTMSCVMCRRDVIVELNGFDERFHTHDDLDLYLRISKSHSIDFVPDYLVKYYASESSLSKSISLLIKDKIKFLDKYREQIKYYGYTDIHFRTIGLNYHVLGNNKEARRYYIKSKKIKPYNILSYLLLALTFAPNSFFVFVRSSWQRFFPLRNLIDKYYHLLINDNS